MSADPPVVVSSQDHSTCHDLECNCIHEKHPRGAKGVGCSCISRQAREREQIRTLQTALQRYARHDANCPAAAIRADDLREKRRMIPDRTSYQRGYQQGKADAEQFSRLLLQVIVRCMERWEQQEARIRELTQ